MFQFFLKIVKKICLGIILIFGYNTFLSSLNIVIPINIITISIASILDVPGIIMIVSFFLFNY